MTLPVSLSPLLAVNATLLADVGQVAAQPRWLMAIAVAAALDLMTPGGVVAPDLVAAMRAMVHLRPGRPPGRLPYDRRNGRSLRPSLRR